MDKNNMNKVVLATVLALALVVGGVVWAMNSDDDTKNNESSTSTSQTQEEEKMEKSAGTIVEVASKTDSLSTLVTAVKAASLVETLQSEGPFTVFAPTNAAFAALPAGTLDSLLLPENVEQLKAVLTYHVVSGKVMAADLKDGQEVTTVQGEKLTVSIMDSKVYLTDAKGGKVMVEKADVAADNGVVHVISGVLLPS